MQVRRAPDKGATDKAHGLVPSSDRKRAKSKNARTVESSLAHKHKTLRGSAKEIHQVHEPDLDDRRTLIVRTSPQTWHRPANRGCFPCRSSRSTHHSDKHKPQPGPRQRQTTQPARSSVTEASVAPSPLRREPPYRNQPGRPSHSPSPMFLTSGTPRKPHKARTGQEQKPQLGRRTIRGEESTDRHRCASSHIEKDLLSKSRATREPQTRMRPNKGVRTQARPIGLKDRAPGNRPSHRASNPKRCDRP